MKRKKTEDQKLSWTSQETQVLIKASMDHNKLNFQSHQSLTDPAPEKKSSNFVEK